MSLTSITPPATEPFVAQDLRKALRLEADENDQDDLITSYIAAARRRTEAYLRCRLITQTVRLTLDSFPIGCYGIPLHIGPIQSVDKVLYLDSSGAEVTLPPERYSLSVSQQPNRLFPAYGTTWPTTLLYPDAARIDLVVGYGDAPGDIPADIMQAMRLDVAYMFQSREAVLLNGSAQEMPMGMRDLLAPHRRWF